MFEEGMEEPMAARNPLHHFAERRRLRRQGKMPDPATFPLQRAPRPLIPWNVRIAILPKAAARLAAVGKSLKLTRPRLVGGIVGWFASQSKVFQAAVLSYDSKPRSSRFSAVLLKQLLAR
jgi:hypothetical protein